MVVEILANTEQPRILASHSELFIYLLSREMAARRTVIQQ